jgi:hypothetical protein
MTAAVAAPRRRNTRPQVVRPQAVRPLSVPPQAVAPPSVPPQADRPTRDARTVGSVPVSRSRAPVTRAVYRRRRTVAFGGVAGLVLGGWMGVQALVAGAQGALGATQPIAAHVVVVKPGDTLWSIALASGAKGDIRPLVDELSAEVHGEPLRVGERIVIPGR